MPQLMQVIPFHGPCVPQLGQFHDQCGAPSSATGVNPLLWPSVTTASFSPSVKESTAQRLSTRTRTPSTYSRRCSESDRRVCSASSSSVMFPRSNEWEDLCHVCWNLVAEIVRVKNVTGPKASRALAKVSDVSASNSECYR